MKITALINKINSVAPLKFAEKWDNVGINVGDGSAEISSAVTCLDISEEVIDFAISRQANLIISHHPLIFGNINSVTPSNLIGKIIYKLIQNNITLLVLHTNFDKSVYNQSYDIATNLELKKLSPLKITDSEYLYKISVFVPDASCASLKQALSEAGAGSIGNYSECGYMLSGFGEFRGNESSNPAIGKPGILEKVSETRLEMVFPEGLQSKIIDAVLKNHPYEEPAYDIYQLKNIYKQYGYGIIGEFDKPLKFEEFLNKLKSVISNESFIEIGNPPELINKVGIVNGSGFEFYKNALAQKCDVFITGDISYHRAHEIKFSGLYTLDCTHFGTEKNFSKCFDRLLAALIDTNGELNKIKFYSFENSVNPMERI